MTESSYNDINALTSRSEYENYQRGGGGGRGRRKNDTYDASPSVAVAATSFYPHIETTATNGMASVASAGASYYSQIGHGGGVGGGRYESCGGKYENGGGKYEKGGGKYENGGGRYENGGGRYKNGDNDAIAAAYYSNLVGDSSTVAVAEIAAAGGGGERYRGGERDRENHNSFSNLMYENQSRFLTTTTSDYNEYPSEYYGSGEASHLQTDAECRAPIVLPYEPHFECNINTLNGYDIHDVYQVNLDGEALAGGGFGSVFKGHHLFLGDDLTVAVKEISFEVSHPSDFGHEVLVEEMSNKVAEIAILKEFRNCPGMLHLHEYFVKNDPTSHITNLNVYIVSEFLAGGELFHCIVRRYKQKQNMNAFTEASVRQIFRILLDAIEFMHERHVVHRDLKPNNLLLEQPDMPTTLKVADFGQSKKLPLGSKTKTYCGTPGYRPPEIWERKEYDHSIDIFAAGVILFFMLAGYQPFSWYKNQIPNKTIRCEYKADKESWKRVSEDAKSLIKCLLTKADRRIGIQEILKHKWMVGDDNTHVKHDLTENYRGLEKNLKEDHFKDNETMLSNEQAYESKMRAFSSHEPPKAAGYGSQHGKSSYAAATASRRTALSKSASNSQVEDYAYMKMTAYEAAKSLSYKNLLLAQQEMTSALQTSLAPQISLSFADESIACSDDRVPIGSCTLINHILSKCKQDRYTEAVARRYCRMMLQAVNKLHHCNVVHRNIDFSSLLVSRGGGDIVFCGMSHATNISGEGGEEAGLTGYCGSPYRFTAPEVYTDFTYSEKVDMWGIGVIMYFLLCGIDPFSGVGKDPERLRRKNQLDFSLGGSDKPSQFARDLLRKLLKSNPRERFSAKEALEHYWFMVDDESLDEIDLAFAYMGLYDV